MANEDGKIPIKDILDYQRDRETNIFYRIFAAQQRNNDMLKIIIDQMENKKMNLTPTSRENNILQLFKSKKHKTTGEIAKSLKMNKPNACFYLKSLEQKGKLIKVRHGQYKIAE